MKIDFATQILNAEDIKEEKTFAIGDVSVIMDILRSKMYSNPIKVICQEIMSNARDAHREFGNEDLPIRVILPSISNPQLEIRDFGIGITPDRMANVFVNYGCSTKRSDNNQTGGFGLGAKSPFAYTDNFIIETFIPENDKIMRRRYVAAIDPSRTGKLLLIDGPEESNEPRGTKIIISVKPNDFSSFEENVFSTCIFWDIHPIITYHNGDSVNIPSLDVSFRCNEGITFENNLDCIISSSIIVIDGIQYPFPNNFFAARAPKQYALFFNTGEISVNANRESIDIRNDTISKIENRYKKFKEALNEHCVKQFSQITDFFNAVVFYNKFKDIAVSLTSSWNDMSLEYLTFQGCDIRKVVRPFMTKRKYPILKKIDNISSFELCNSKIITYDARDMNKTAKGLEKIMDGVIRHNNILLEKHNVFVIISINNQNVKNSSTDFLLEKSISLKDNLPPISTITSNGKLSTTSIRRKNPVFVYDGNSVEIWERKDVYDKNIPFVKSRGEINETINVEDNKGFYEVTMGNKIISHEFLDKIMDFLEIDYVAILPSVASYSKKMKMLYELLCKKTKDIKTIIEKEFKDYVKDNRYFSLNRIGKISFLRAQSIYDLNNYCDLFIKHLENIKIIDPKIINIFKEIKDITSLYCNMKYTEMQTFIINLYNIMGWDDSQIINIMDKNLNHIAKTIYGKFETIKDIIDVNYMDFEYDFSSMEIKHHAALFIALSKLKELEISNEKLGP